MKLTYGKLRKTSPLMALLQAVHRWWYRKQQQLTNPSYLGCTWPGLQIPRSGWRAELFKASKMGLISAAELENNLAVYAATLLNYISHAACLRKVLTSNLLVAIRANALGIHIAPLVQKSAGSGGYRGVRTSILKCGRRCEKLLKYFVSYDFATHLLDAYHLQHSAYARSLMNTYASAASKKCQIMKPFLKREKLERPAVLLSTICTFH